LWFKRLFVDDITVLLHPLVLKGVGWEAKKIEYKEAKPFPCVIGNPSIRGFLGLLNVF
jgi:hypothetical protein